MLAYQILPEDIEAYDSGLCFRESPHQKLANNMVLTYQPILGSRSVPSDEVAHLMIAVLLTCNKLIAFVFLFFLSFHVLAEID